MGLDFIVNLQKNKALPRTCGFGMWSPGTPGSAGTPGGEEAKEQDGKGDDEASDFEDCCGSKTTM